MNSNTPVTGNAASRGRPRSTEVHKSILDATLALLAEVGVEKTSIEMVAQRAGVGKTSIYRRWSSKEALIVDALELLKPDWDSTTVTGRLADVIYERARDFTQRMNNPLGKQMLSLLISTLSGSTQVSESYWENHSLPKTKDVADLLRHNIETENLRDDVDFELAADLIIGYIMYQLMIKPPSSDLDSGLKTGIEIMMNGLKRRT